MNEIKRREIELLAKVCYKNDVHLKLAKELIKAAQKHSYENVSQGARLNEYEELIKYFGKQQNGDQL
ncbi:DNA modification system-associated small protein [Cytobacillus gottheilii]|uniref:DNA modification system-associated small protein n=1 Tax=Cytobacillus gottheilii TaxID=859144 RepID=UPI003CEF3A55